MSTTTCELLFGRRSDEPVSCFCWNMDTTRRQSSLRSGFIVVSELSMADCAAAPALPYAPAIVPFGEVHSARSRVLRPAVCSAVFARVLDVPMHPPAWDLARARPAGREHAKAQMRAAISAVASTCGTATLQRT